MTPPLELRPDLDAIEALSPEREALWSRLEKASFLNQNEKRAAVGYGAVDGRDASQESKFNPSQLRVPAGQPGGGQWTSGDRADDASEGNEGQANVIPVAKRVESLRRFGKSTVREFVARYCKGKINRELPGQFENVTIEDVFNLARGGDRAAKTCLKLLDREEYRK